MGGSVVGFGNFLKSNEKAGTAKQPPPEASIMSIKVHMVGFQSLKCLKQNDDPGESLRRAVLQLGYCNR